MTNDLFLKEMGKRIRAIRKAKKVSLRQLEKLTDIDDVNLMRIEHGRKNSHILTLNSIANALDVDVANFFK